LLHVLRVFPNVAVRIVAAPKPCVTRFDAAGSLYASYLPAIRRCRWAIAEAVPSDVHEFACGSFEDLMKRSGSGAPERQPKGNDGTNEGTGTVGSYHDIRLPDGRRLAFAQFGPADGLPVIGFHGGLSCRLETRFAASLCDELGVRLITPDRPGIGRSDTQPARRLVDWPSDVEALVDALGIQTFAAFGWSAGGPYALACGCFLSHRISRLATIAGIAPVNGPGEVKKLGLPADRMLFPLCRVAPRVAAVLLGLSRFQSRGMIVRSLLGALRTTGDPDVAILEPNFMPTIAESYREALRSGGFGTAWDYHILGGEWGFDLAQVRREVIVWHGERDGLLPVGHARRLVKTLPRATFNLAHGRGHFLPHTCFRDLLASLLD